MANERKHDKIDRHNSQCSLYETPSREEWNRHCFQIVHAHHRDDESTPKTTTRVFTAPIQDRNQWVFAMNSALLGYARRSGKARSTDAAKDGCPAPLLNKRTKGAGLSVVDGIVPRGAAGDPRRRASRVIPNGHGGGRARSPSPVRAASMGLPPMPPRRMRSSPTWCSARSLPSLLDVAYQ